MGYDKMRMDTLSRKDILLYAKNEFQFDIPPGVLDNIWEHRTEYSAKHGERGVNFENFQLVKVAIGIAREMKRDKQRRTDRVEKERLLEVKKVELQEQIQEAKVAVTEADRSVT